MRLPSLLLAAVLVLLVSVTGTTALAANYDDRVVAPVAPKSASLRAAMHAYVQLYERLGPDGVLRDPAAYAKRLQAEWLLKRAVDEGNAGDLAEFGWLRSADGSYSVKLRQFPQWRHFDAWLQLLSDPGFLSDNVAEQLRQRGFRDQDLATLRTYLETQSLGKEVARANAPLTLQFAERVRADTRARRSVDRAKVKSYIYQTGRATDEARRSWAVGLLDTLDKQRQRILVTHFLDTPGGRAISPTHDADAGIDAYVQLLQSGEAERLIERDLVGSEQR